MFLIRRRWPPVFILHLCGHLLRKSSYRLLLHLGISMVCLIFLWPSILCKFSIFTPDGAYLGSGRYDAPGKVCVFTWIYPVVPIIFKGYYNRRCLSSVPHNRIFQYLHYRGQWAADIRYADLIRSRLLIRCILLSCIARNPKPVHPDSANQCTSGTTNRSRTLSKREPSGTFNTFDSFHFLFCQEFYAFTAIEFQSAIKLRMILSNIPWASP